ncbi:MAG: tetratricopeptide repeat protein, partial [Candidatus Methanofastidiosa archaeon]|nr:tetratricopeptide repeat protein [Candidatus Methanofastidiosa archaeon]
KKAIEKDPTSNIAYFSIGLEYYFLEEYIEAAESFQRSIEIDPKFVFAYNGLAMGYM